MTLTEKQKQAIIHEFNAFKDKMYAGKTKKERENLGQFFTPANLTIQILEALNCTQEEFINSDILDPTSGSGNLLAAAIIVGVNPTRVFGNEYDNHMVRACKNRLKSIPDRLQDFDIDLATKIAQGLQKFRPWQIHQGDATDPKCLKFSSSYKWKPKEEQTEAEQLGEAIDDMLALFMGGNYND